MQEKDTNAPSAGKQNSPTSLADGTQGTAKRDANFENRRKMTYKEKCEYERLSKEIESLTNEQHELESQLCSGTLSVEELTEKSKRLPEIKELLDEKELRWLELSEIE